MAKVSVVISTFNRKDRLALAIQSVIDQTYTDWELIVVDDHSPDDTVNLLKSYKDPRISFISLPENFGNDTRPKNVGIKNATGEFVALLDDDNTWRPDHLSALVRELDAEPGLTAVYCDRWVHDLDGNIPDRMGIAFDYSPGRLMAHNYIDTSDVLIRRDALLYVGGFDERYRKYVDWNLWVRLAKAGFLFRRVPLILTDYNLHQNQKSQTVQDRLPDGSPSVPLGAAPTHTPEWDAYDLEIRLPYLGAIPEPRVAIFSLTYDRLAYTEACFASLYKTAGYEFDHVIVDNGSTDETVIWLKKTYPKAHIIPNAENKGISIASNQALDYLKDKGYDIIMKIDNDCLFLTDGWLSKMVDIWKRNHMIAMSCYIQGLRDNPGGAPRIGRGQINKETLGMTKHLGGICHFVSAKAYEDFRWPENSFLHGMQDLELSQHLIQNGYGMGYLENYFAEHYEGTDGQHARYPEYFERRKTEKRTRYEANKRP